MKRTSCETTGKKYSGIQRLNFKILAVIAELTPLNGYFNSIIAFKRSVAKTSQGSFPKVYAEITEPLPNDHENVSRKGKKELFNS